MNPAAARWLAVGVGALLVADLAAAVGVRSGGRTTAAGTAGPSPAASVTTTSTAAAPVPVGPYPHTGLAAFSSQRLGRPPLSVKIDDAPGARPQAGLDAADLITEEVVEGGLTRFFVTFQSQDAPSVGPVRSARPVDTDLLGELGGGLFAYSGGAAGVVAGIRRNSGAVLLTPQAGSPVFHRAASRPAPENLYSSTAQLYAEGARLAHGLNPPPPLFHYSRVAPPSATPANTVSLGFSTVTAATWTWNAAARSYDRGDGTMLATQQDGSLVTAADVVVLAVTTTPSGDFDVLGHQNPLPVLTGTGRCWVLRDGLVVPGSWQRGDAHSPISLVGAGGEVLDLHPGRTWLELLPAPAQPVFG